MSGRDGRSTDTRERIRHVALSLFVRHGCSHTTLQDIADELGLTRAALYYHHPAFYYHHPSKDRLIASPVQPAKNDIDDFLAWAADTEPPPREVLAGFFELEYRHRQIVLALVRDHRTRKRRRRGLGDRMQRNGVCGAVAGGRRRSRSLR